MLAAKISPGTFWLLNLVRGTILSEVFVERCPNGKDGRTTSVHMYVCISVCVLLLNLTL